ncbi:MBL fold metallo-hydrolase [Nitrosococcus oceani]|uniref:MBL fold metallo-hydrolase n=1 Tax=Nitrosococcus oceani TaxID=1229 RepID=UPI0004E8E212|nr:MBL fold metallo-hydrolase [Nitrosococcus oceani]KFI22825.1 Zn-dependent hydrolase [Nitrosococcus oceani]
MLFKQLFEPVSFTYSYLLACPETGQCALIDPVIDTAERDLEILQKLGLKLTYTIDTHVHADHLTGALKLKQLTGSQICYPAMDQFSCVDIGLREGESFSIGNIELHPLFTPGHTDTHHCYIVDDQTHTLLFSGDALLIDACGRTDFQQGDTTSLYHSIRDKLFILPDETLVYPAHNYEGRFISTIAQEKKRNPRIKESTSLEDFTTIMNNLDLPYPQKIDFAVPGNQMCGQCPPNVPEEFRAPCGAYDQG